MQHVQQSNQYQHQHVQQQSQQYNQRFKQYQNQQPIHACVPNVINIISNIIICDNNIDNIDDNINNIIDIINANILNNINNINNQNTDNIDNNDEGKNSNDNININIHKPSHEGIEIKHNNDNQNQKENKNDNKKKKIKKRNNQNNELLNYINEEYNQPNLIAITSKLRDNQKRNYQKFENDIMHVLYTRNNLDQTEDIDRHNLSTIINRQYIIPDIDNAINNSQKRKNINEIKRNFENYAIKFQQ